MSEHTALPWRFRPIGEARGVIEGPGADCTIATMARWFPPHDPEEQRANGIFIARACNGHADLLAFARCFREWWANHFDDFDRDINSQLLCLDNDAEAAIANATD